MEQLKPGTKIRINDDLIKFHKKIGIDEPCAKRLAGSEAIIKKHAFGIFYHVQFYNEQWTLSINEFRVIPE